MEAGALNWHEPTEMPGGVLVLAFSGWMDGGEVSTGTVRRLIGLLHARPAASIDGEGYYIYAFPGSMEVSAMFRPTITVEDGLLTSLDPPSNTFFCDHKQKLAMFVGKEPNLNWRGFADRLLAFVEQARIERIIFVGSFGGSVPHTREPRLFFSVSARELLDEGKALGLRPSNYEGPGSFSTYLMARARERGIAMFNLVAEIPGYLQGRNPLSIEAVSRRLAAILKLPLQLDELRDESNAWETQVTRAIEKDEDLAEQVRKLEQEYDDELISNDSEPAGE
jgi:proteasome assembly chaperone (PAC2) family protein